MKFVKVRVLALCMVVAAVVVLVGCGSASAPSKGSEPKQEDASSAPAITEGLKQEGKLTVGIRSSSVAPFIITSLNSLDTATGLDVDLACALASELGIEATFVSVDDVGQALESKCDVIMSVPSNEANGFEVVGDYAESTLALFHTGEPTVVSAGDVQGARVALQEGSSAQTALQLTELEVQEVPCSSLNEAFEALASEEADYVLCHASSGAYLTSWRDGVSFAGALSDPVAQGVAVASGNEPVSAGVRTAYETLQQNGVLTEIRKSWLGDLPVLTASSVIQNIPMRETEGESLADFADSAEALSSARDGSMAGANAVSLSEVESASSSGTGSGYEDTSYSQTYGDYQYYDDDDYYGYTSTNVSADLGSPVTDTYGGGDTSYDDQGSYDNGASADGSDSASYARYEGGTDSLGYEEATDYGSGGNYTES